MSINTTEFEIGARGWIHSQWLGPFYPDDLPEEWWFAYYCNQFHTVLVPQDVFRQSVLADMENWLESCSDEFKFYIELSQNTNMEQIKPQISRLKSQLAGFVLRLDTESDTVPERFEALIAKALETAPTYIDMGIASIIDMEEVMHLSHELGCCCEIQDLQSNWVKPFKRGLLLSPETNSQKSVQLRKLLDSCLSNNTLVVYSLFFTGSTPQIQDVETMQTIYTLWA